MQQAHKNLSSWRGFHWSVCFPSSITSFRPVQGRLALTLISAFSAWLIRAPHGSERITASKITHKDTWKASAINIFPSASVSRRGAGCHHGGGCPGWHAEDGGIAHTSCSPCRSVSTSWSKAFDSCHAGCWLLPRTHWHHLAWLKTP